MTVNGRLKAMQDRGAVDLALAEEVLKSYGKLRILARGSSMVPTIFPGDILLVERDPVGRLRPGHIVLASRGGRFYAHRVVKLTALGGPPRVITRGDALRENDPPFLDEEVLGRVTALVRGQEQIELENEDEPAGKGLLQWVVRHSDGVTAGLLWRHSLRGRIASPPGKTQSRFAGRLAECM
jgi:signal peptidase I